MTPLLQTDDGRLLNQLVVWAPDPAVRKKILVDNPAQLYGFGGTFRTHPINAWGSSFGSHDATLLRQVKAWPSVSSSAPQSLLRWGR